MAVETLGFNRAEAIFEEQFIVYHPAYGVLCVERDERLIGYFKVIRGIEFLHKMQFDDNSQHQLNSVKGILIRIDECKIVTQ